MPDKIDFKLELGKIYLRAGQQSCDDCGSNGLPVTPNSISIVGNFKALVDGVVHENLVQYVDCYRTKNEKVCLVFEHYANQNHNVGNVNIEQLFGDLISGLHYLHYKRRLVHGAISRDMIVNDGERFKWTHWPLCSITEHGRLLDADTLLPVDMSCLAPEGVLSPRTKSSRKSDVWSLGMIMLYYLTNGQAKIPRNPAVFLSCSTYEQVLKTCHVNQTFDKRWSTLLPMLLEPSVRKRASSAKLLTLYDPDYRPSFNCVDFSVEPSPAPLIPNAPLTLHELYYFFCLISSNSRQNRDSDREKSRPPILNTPSLVFLESPRGVFNSQISTQEMPNSRLEAAFIGTEIDLLPLETLKQRLSSLPMSVFYPLISVENEHLNGEQNDDDKKSNDSSLNKISLNELSSELNGNVDPTSTQNQPQNLPLVIRELDFVYQVHRTLLFRRLTSESPFLKSMLVSVARTDISPLYRAATWASLLDVKASQLAIYDKIDKLSPTSTDRQISVDIPRCHQYNDLLASAAGHIKLARMLKSWLAVNEPRGSVYWQGLDSLAAPFVVLSFADEPRAFASFNAFTGKYLRGFFARDNSAVIHEYLALFSRLITFHDPALAKHLRCIRFSPELYAIPWFLTMFTHVLPLHKILHFWDSLLLEDEGFPLVIGLAILRQLRDQLMEFGFNECILMFSEMPEIEVERCIRDAGSLWKVTPRSAVKRDLFELSCLQEELCPRLELNEFIELVSESNRRLMVIDRRPEQEYIKFGAIRDAYRLETVQAIRDKLKDKGKYFALIIVNDSQLAMTLLEDHVIPKVCNIELNNFLPPSLRS